MPGGSSATCVAVNVGKKPVAISFEILNASGQVQTSTSATVGVGSSFTLSQGLASNSARYCRFTFSAGARTVRASLCIFQNGGCSTVNPAR